MKVLIIGSGLSGATIANKYATLGINVTVIDKRDHIAGNVYDYMEHGVRVNKYGPHLFHTNDDEVWEFLQNFGKWKRWDHTVVADISGIYVPVPVNITTVNMLCEKNIKNEEEMNEWLESVQVKGEINNSEDMALSRVGHDLYNKLFQGYTLKQWAKDARTLDKSILSRIPVRNNFDNRYFTDKYQALPVDGYTAIVSKMLSHPLITVKLNYDWEQAKDDLSWDTLIFTGPIDSYFNNSGLPKLEYRSLDFDWEIIKHSGYYQPYSQINFPSSNTQYTRCIEYKHFLHQQSDYTVICKETSSDNGEPYYPIPTKENLELYDRYKVLAEANNNVHFIGRLASYKYFNMDQAIRNALDYFDTVLKKSIIKRPVEIVSLGG